MNLIGGTSAKRQGSRYGRSRTEPVSLPDRALPEAGSFPRVRADGTNLLALFLLAAHMLKTARLRKQVQGTWIKASTSGA